MDIRFAVAGVTAAAAAVLATQCPPVESAIISAGNTVVVAAHQITGCPLGHRINNCGAAPLPWSSSGSVTGDPYAMFGITPGGVVQKSETFLIEVGRTAADAWRAAFGR